jgi:hypothetical protein
VAATFRAGFEGVAVFKVGAAFFTARGVFVGAAVTGSRGTGRCSNVAHAFGWPRLQDS